MKLTVYVILCLIWGSTWLAIKVGLQDAPPMTTAAIRFSIATIILVTISLMRGVRPPKDLKYMLSLAFPGLFIYGLSYALVYTAEQFIDSALAAVLFGTFPFFVAALSWLLYKKERLSRAAWAAMAVGFSGVVLISYESLTMSGDLFLGTILTVLASFAAGFGTVIHKHKFSNEKVFLAVTTQMIAGTILMIIAAFIIEDPLSVNLTRSAVGSILYLAVVGTVFSFVGYYWLLTHMRAVSVSLIAFITPLVAILVGVTLGGEQLSLTIIIGTILILSGVVAVVRK